MRRRLASLFVVALLGLSALPTSGAQAAALPEVSLGDLVVTEPSGRSGTATVALAIALNVPPTSAVVVGWRTVAGSAGTADFVANSGSLTINAGSQGGGISLGVRADRASEPLESFTVELTSVTGATITDGVGRVDIRDAATGLAVSDVTVWSRMRAGSTWPSPSRFRARPRSPSHSPGSSGPARHRRERRGERIGLGGDPKGRAVVDPIRARQRRHHRRNRREPRDRRRLGQERRARRRHRPDHHPERRRGAADAKSDTDPDTDPHPDPHCITGPDPAAGLADWQPPGGVDPWRRHRRLPASATGDHIGQGRTYTYTLADALLAFDPAGDRFSVHVRGDETWDGWFAPQAAGVPLRPARGPACAAIPSTSPA